MDKYIKYHNVKSTFTAFTDDNKREVDLISNIISQIIERRHELGISQRDLEKLAGVRQAVICRIENMQNIPRIDTLIRIMEPLGMRLSVTRHE